MAGADHERLAVLEAETRAEAESCKWLAVALGGVGALLLGAIQFANLGSLEEPERIVAAVLGGLVAAGGVVTAIAVTVAAMLPVSLTFADVTRAEGGNDRGTKPLRNWLDDNRARLLRGDERVEDLSGDYTAALKEQRRAYEAHREDPGDPEKRRRAAASGEWVLYLNGIVSELVAEAKLHLTRRAVRRSRRVVIGTSVLVALGIVTLIFATTAPEESAIDLRGADLSELTLGDVELRGVNLSGLKIEDANFVGADLREAEIEGTKWVNTICPDGVNSDVAGKTCAGHLKP